MAALTVEAAKAFVLAQYAAPGYRVVDAALTTVDGRPTVKVLVKEPGGSNTTRRVWLDAAGRLIDKRG